MTKRSMLVLTAATALLLPASAIHAQDPGGTWTVQFGAWQMETASSVRLEGFPASGELVVTRSGETVVAILRTPGAGTSMRADTLKGELREGQVKLSGSRVWRAQTTGGADAGISEEAQASRATIDLEARASEDGTLTGTIRMNLGGTMSIRAPLTGARPPADGRAPPAESGVGPSDRL